MVSTASLICIFITLAIAFLVPLGGLLVYALKNKHEGIVIAWFLGAAGFFVTQMVVRTTILGILGTQNGLYHLCKTTMWYMHLSSLSQPDCLNLQAVSP